MNLLTEVRFSLDDAQRAADEWNANCGPGAIAAVLGLTLDEVRPHLVDFESKGYTNPTLMYMILRNLGVKWTALRVDFPGEQIWPKLGLVRIQWEGPWTRPGVPMRARYRQTHWVGSRVVPPVPLTDAGDILTTGRVEIFDINCMCTGGWVTLEEWAGLVVPWLLKEAVPRADGKWHQTHALRIDEPLKVIT